MRRCYKRQVSIPDQHAPVSQAAGAYTRPACAGAASRRCVYRTSMCRVMNPAGVCCGLGLGGLLASPRVPFSARNQVLGASHLAELGEKKRGQGGGGYSVPSTPSSESREHDSFKKSDCGNILQARKSDFLLRAFSPVAEVAEGEASVTAPPLPWTELPPPLPPPFYRGSMRHTSGRCVHFCGQHALVLQAAGECTRPACAGVASGR